MAKITWTNKVTIDPRPDIPAANKLTADDINEVKTSVNAAYDEIDALEVDHAALEVDFTNHKINVSNPHEVTASQLPDLQSSIDATTDPIIADVANLEANKVDKVTGQSLITDAERTKLQGIEAGAEVNTVDPTDLADLAADYNAKLDLKVDKVTGQRLMSNAEGTKLAGIEAGAEVNTVSPSDLTALETSLNSTIDADVAAEADLRSAADTTLQNNIDAESATREATDVTLQENIDAEALARDAADVALQAGIDTRLPIDGISSIDLPTEPTVGDWYTVATMATNTISVGEFDFLSTGGGEHNLIKFFAGAAYHQNSFVNIVAKTTYFAGQDIMAIRVLVGDVSSSGAKLQIKFQDAAVFNPTLTLRNYTGSQNNSWTLIEPIVQNTVVGYSQGAIVELVADSSTQQSGNNYVLNDKRVLNTDDLTTVTASIATKEPLISPKNSGFNLPVGTTAGTVKAGDWVPTWAQVTGKPLTFTPNLNSTFTNVQDTVVNTDDSVDLTMGNIFYATALADTVFSMSLTGSQNKQCRLIVDILGGEIGSITFSGTGVKSHVEPPSGGGFYAEGCTLQFDITIIGTSIFVNMVGGEMT